MSVHGRNGSGKTTLLRMIPPLLHAAEGEVRVFGLDPWKNQDQVRKPLGYMSEADSYPPRLRVEDLFKLCSLTHPDWKMSMAQDFLNNFRIHPKSEIGGLSSGQQRQVAIIAATCHNPRLLVLDEPAGHLDAVARRELLEVVIEMASRSGSTIIFSSHQFSDVRRVANRVAIIHLGKVLHEGAITDFEDNACRVYIESADKQLTDSLVKTEGCARVSVDENQTTATFHQGAQKAIGEMQKLGIDTESVDIHPINLEDLFIDWTRQ